MDVSKLTPGQRQTRQNVRNYLMVATRKDMQAELAVSLEQGDTFRADCIREMIAEDVASINDAIHGDR